jgi:hypothetical protein
MSEVCKGFSPNGGAKANNNATSVQEDQELLDNHGEVLEGNPELRVIQGVEPQEMGLSEVIRDDRMDEVQAQCEETVEELEIQDNESRPKSKTSSKKSYSGISLGEQYYEDRAEQFDMD